MGKDAKEGMTINVHKPRLPKFEEGKDDMDTYNDMRDLPKHRNGRMTNW